MLAPFGANSKRLLSKEGRRKQLLGEMTQKVVFFFPQKLKNISFVLFFLPVFIVLQQRSKLSFQGPQRV